MNFVKSRVIIRRIYRVRTVFYLIPALFLFFYLSGCSDQVVLPSVEQLIEFENAAPLHPAVDLDRLVKAKIVGGDYHVVPGEVLELTMPAILRIITTDESIGPEKDSIYICRIRDNGAITLPIIGQINVADKTLAQIESVIIDAYYPEYALTVPSVFAKVLEYKTAKVSINGAVQNPGIYSLRSDQMSLVALIMESGGIIDEGAAVIKIIRSEYETKPNSDTIPEDINYEKARQVTESINTKLIEPIVSYPNSNDNKVKLNFRQISKGSPTGIITINYERKVILTEQMDITSEIERLVLLKQLSWREPRISTVDVGHKLCTLADSIKPGSGSSRIEKSIVNKYIVSHADVNMDRNKNPIFHENNIEHEPKMFLADETRWPRAVELYNPGYSSYYDTRGESRYTNVGQKADDPKLNASIYKAINEELNEILDIVTIQNDVKKDDSKGYREPESIILPVKGFNIPFTDVVLKDGDSVIVERLAQPLFSVVGLVNRSGNFPYPPNVQYNLMQALAFAGGLDPTAEPHYVTVYRLKQDGSIVHASFKIVKSGNSSQLTEALNVRIKPGDIVSVEHTPRTRTKVFLDSIFRINLGTYFSLNEMWDE